MKPLWFDVEKRYNTTGGLPETLCAALWFDVEKRYNTTRAKHEHKGKSCGLMQRNDIIQLFSCLTFTAFRCGLM